ncbi:class I SAM-dependent methyltransferase [Crossiella cryophila]|uniref:SAM-dependent methyltransferase n=1 Tax=Crossiella cryophila TaxID=43355 RepID=A0A7W7CFY8_9PSEU|nr:class I SAM-dependent methyltransferase [Crossiella cryophila]MBB4680459.1 SAM-dependent methyltransferase [Crossiella cryophila]
MGTYPFDNAVDAARTRMAALEATYDTVTTPLLAELGVAPGWRCWEVGAGGGSIARWLGERVGPDGYVLATDLDTRLLELAPPVEIQRHDVLTDPLPPGGFDLIHCRLVLIHHPARDAAVAKLTAALNPGGVLLLEEILPKEQRVLSTATCQQDSFWAVQTQVLEVLTKLGSDDLDWALGMEKLFVHCGLDQVAASRSTPIWVGGGEGSKLLLANAWELRDKLRAAGVGPGELAQFTRLLRDPGFSVTAYPLLSTWGRAPR